MSLASNHKRERQANTETDQLVAGCRTGDHDAQRRLYEACLPLVSRLAVRMVGSQDAMDVAQQTFLQAFSRLDQYDGHASFETWLYRLAVNEALQFLRKRKKWRQCQLEYEPEDDSSRFDEASQLAELLQRALDRIDLPLRSILLLRESEGLSYSEIAQALDVPEGTVGSRLNRARRELCEQLTNLGWTP